MRFVLACLCAAAAMPALSQTAQVGADLSQRASDRLQLEHLHYRPARWDKEQIVEFENEHPNQGGLLYLYMSNTTSEPITLRYWMANRRDRSYWILHHFVSWDRLHNETIAPGQLGILEINALSKDFAPNAPFRFNYMDRDSRNVLSWKGTLTEGAHRISNIRVWPDMQTLTIHLRSSSAETIPVESIAVEGMESTTERIVHAAGAAIARVKLAQPLTPGQLLIVRANIKSGETVTPILAHRRAHADVFPIGVWSVNDDTAPLLQQMNIDTAVAGGSANDAFYEWGLAHGLRNMVHSGVPTNVDRVRELKDKPSVLCWMLMDEPDWSIPANIMLHTDNEIRQYDVSKPTFITLCRNIKFMEYGPIADIPCQDHYSVTAPSSSKWPKPYGTRLEETGIYTRDLKYAAEPKPVWIWTQGIGDWGERPKRPVPTPNEIAAQLNFNLGQGAKGILWFNHSKGLHEKWPDAVEAMTQWSRVMQLLREDLLDADVWTTHGITAPEGVDVAPLLGMDKLTICLTNTRYEIHPEAYPFRPFDQVELSIPWSNPAPTKVVRITHDGEQELVSTFDAGTLKVQTGHLEAAAIIQLR